ncbi:MAG: hypothetical protein ABI867_40975 [Kofleriaceae bacterium]
MRAAALAVVCACSSDPAPPAIEVVTPTGARDVFTGTITVAGKPGAPTACSPGHSVHTFVEVVTSAGKLRFEDQQLYWNPTPGAITRGDRLECTKLDRSWGGGNRSDGTSYWRGTLVFTCGAITGDLDLDCGSITKEERAQLDANRRSMQDDQRGSSRDR